MRGLEPAGFGVPQPRGFGGTVMSQEAERVAQLAGWYQSGQLDFDRRMIAYKYRSFQEWLQGPYGLELGPADGTMTRLLVGDFELLTIVDGSAELLQTIPSSAKLVKVHALFEDFQSAPIFNTILMAHILEHIEDPAALIRRACGWLAPGGRLIASVPNGLSIHRLAGVKMGFLKCSCDLNDRDLALGHRRVYMPATFREEFTRAGMRVVHTGGVFFKPLSNQQIEETWTDRMMEGFYELGKDFPDNAAELYVVAETNRPS
jgi:2-polyprenyl-3-methyl-5-hydroxy-6-metoxy-1,4-benzoquinol methylase